MSESLGESLPNENEDTTRDVTKETNLDQPLVEKSERRDKSSRVTEAQETFLVQYGFEAPTKAIASRLISFIKEGLPTDFGATNEEERVHLLRSVKMMWEKKVVINRDGREGVIQYIIPKTAYEVLEAKKSMMRMQGNKLISQGESLKVGVFNAGVTWNDIKDGRVNVNSLAGLTIKE